VPFFKSVIIIISGNDHFDLIIDGTTNISMILLNAHKKLNKCTNWVCLITNLTRQTRAVIVIHNANKELFNLLFTVHFYRLKEHIKKELIGRRHYFFFRGYSLIESSCSSSLVPSCRFFSSQFSRRSSLTMGCELIWRLKLSCF